MAPLGFNRPQATQNAQLLHRSCAFCIGVLHVAVPPFCDPATRIPERDRLPGACWPRIWGIDQPGGDSVGLLVDQALQRRMGPGMALHLRIADGQQGDGPHMLRQPQGLPHGLFMEAADIAAAQAQLHGPQQDIFYAGRAVQIGQGLPGACPRPSVPPPAEPAPRSTDNSLPHRPTSRTPESKISPAKRPFSLSCPNLCGQNKKRPTEVEIESFS